MSFRALFACAAAAVALSNALSARADLSASQAIDGIVARSQAIASGRLSYTFKSEFYSRGQQAKETVLPEVVASFSESSWAERTKESHSVRINHDGYLLEFVQTPQRDGTTRPGVTLLPSASLASRTELNAPPLFSGLFWHDRQLRYVETHADAFQVTGSTVVNNVSVAVLEATIPAADRREAFHVVSPQLQSGGLMRLYVAAQLGFVVPRIEFLSVKKEAAVVYDAADFGEAAAGIYLPGRISTEIRGAAGEVQYRGEFSIRYELINEGLPPEEFIVNLPRGTHVQDARVPGHVTTFDVAESQSTASLLTAALPSTRSPAGFFGRWRNAILIGIAIGGLGSIAVYFSARSQR
jgi:hypothetical protein